MHTHVRTMRYKLYHSYIAPVSIISAPRSQQVEKKMGKGLPKEDPDEDRDGGEKNGVDVANPLPLGLFPDGAGSADGADPRLPRVAHSLHLRDAAHPE